MSLAIEMCYLQGIGGNIICIDIGQAWFLHGNSNGNSTAASPNVCHDWHMSASNAAFDKLKSRLDEQLSLWPGNKYPSINEKIQAIKLFMLHEIGHWLVLLSACDQCKILLFLQRGNLTLRVSIEYCPFNPQHVTQQHLGIQLSTLHYWIPQHAFSSR